MKTLSRLTLPLASALLLLVLAVSGAAAHYDGKVNLGIDAVSITSATRTSLGDVIVKGTVTCSKTTSGVDVYSTVRQVAGRTNTIRGEGGGTIRCVAGKKIPFSATVEPEYGKFVGGKAVVSVGAYKEFWSYNEDTGEEHYHYDSAYTRQEMKLSR